MYTARNPAFRRLPTQHQPVIQYRPPLVKSLGEVIAERAMRDQGFLALVESVARGNAPIHDLKMFEDYVKTVQQATTATPPANCAPTRQATGSSWS
jgi:hypothetical protein